MLINLYIEGSQRELYALKRTLTALALPYLDATSKDSYTSGLTAATSLKEIEADLFPELQFSDPKENK